MSVLLYSVFHFRLWFSLLWGHWQEFFCVYFRPSRTSGNVALLVYQPRALFTQTTDPPHHPHVRPCVKFFYGYPPQPTETWLQLLSPTRNDLRHFFVVRVHSDFVQCFRLPRSTSICSTDTRELGLVLVLMFIYILIYNSVSTSQNFAIKRFLTSFT